MELNLIVCDSCEAKVDALKADPGWCRFQHRFSNSVDAVPCNLCPTCTGEMIQAINAVLDRQPKTAEPPVIESLEQSERRHILNVVGWANWNKSLAAKQLGIERSTLDRKLKSYGVTRPGHIVPAEATVTA